MKNYALIKNGIVENIVSWDGSGDLFHEYIAVELSDNIAGIGWLYSDGIFTQPPEPEKTTDELIAEANSKKSVLLSTANTAIVPLQDAVDLGMATDAEAALLTEWRTYRVLLSRVDTSAAPDVTWPVLPDCLSQ